METADAVGDSWVYAVVRNDEEQYSIWPDDRPLPPGWVKIGIVGSKQQCLDHIDKVWTDMRPRSLRLRTR
jgi:MbtH protein